MSLTPQLHAITNVICLTAPDSIREARLATNIADDMDKLGPQIRSELAKTYKTIIDGYVKQDQQWFIDTNRAIASIVNDITSIIIGDN
jgi:hypothetical protein